MKKRDLISAGCNRYNGDHAIYFLVQGGTVVYVGKTRDLENRVASHRSDTSKEFEEVFYVRVKTEKASMLERALIRQYKPKLNRESKYCGVGFFDEKVLREFGFNPPRDDRETQRQMLPGPRSSNQSQ